MEPIQVRHLGRVPYREAYDLQRSLHQSGSDYLLVLEHPVTITLGRRADAAPCSLTRQASGPRSSTLTEAVT